MDSFTRFINSLLQLLIQLGDILFRVLVAFELWLRGQLGTLGLSANVQTVIMIAFAVMLIFGSLRFFGGLLRIAVVLILLLIAINILLPVLPR
jgi:hypothetical protein